MATETVSGIDVVDLRHVDPGKVAGWLVHLADNLRGSDAAEVKASSGIAPRDCLHLSFRMSSHAYAVLDRAGEPVAIFGAVPHPVPGIGIVWMLGTDGIKRNAAAIARQTRPRLDDLNRAYVTLWNYVDARNALSLRWLRWGGFDCLAENRTHGVERRPFHIYARTRKPGHV